MKPKDGYIAMIANPKSGASSSGRRDQQFRHYLVDQGYDVRLQLTQSLEHAKDLAVDAGMDDTCSLVVVSGGDGTVREAAHGLVGSNKPLLMIPCGTENLLASELGFDERLKTVIKAFEGDCRHPLDLGQVNGQIFTCMVGLGFDAEVVHMVNSNRTSHIDYFSYAGPMWRTYWEYKAQPVRVEVDGLEIFNDKGMVIVGNISRYALGLHVLRHADYGDGQLDVCIYRCASRIRLAKHMATTLIKKHVDCGDVLYRQGKTVKVTAAPRHNHFVQVDGDPGPALPLTVGVIPQALEVLIPPGAKPAGIRTRIVRAIG